MGFAKKLLFNFVAGVHALNILLTCVIHICNIFKTTKKGFDQTNRSNKSEQESSIAAQIVSPTSVNVTWTDIGGHSEVIEELRATVFLLHKASTLSSQSKLLQPPKGILLYGPPGCGKTMLAKAVAKEAGAKFINVDVSTLTSKWYGESQKMAAAVFTCARNNKPCIIFIDEIDSFLRSRNIGDNETTAMMKAEFLKQWDGLLSSDECKVIVMGATNRPQDIDKAILRRMPAKFYIGLPTRDKRVDILNNILRGEPRANDINLNVIANMTEGFSGSDLKELCREAAMIRVRDLCSRGFGAAEQFDQLRHITMDDFTTAIHKLKESKIPASPGHSD